MSEKEPTFPGAEAGRTVHVYCPHLCIHATRLRVFEWNAPSSVNPQDSLAKFDLLTPILVEMVTRHFCFFVA